MKKTFLLLSAAVVLAVVSPIAFGADNWTPGIEYRAGDTALYNDTLYVCLQYHTAQAAWTPEITAALWNAVPVEADASGIYYWIPRAGYAAGDLADYEGGIYHALVPHASLPGWEPPAVPALWQYLYQADEGTVPTIHSPLAGERFVAGEPVVLTVNTGDSFPQPVWHSSLNGQLGTGNNLAIDWLSTGTHLITVTAGDVQAVVTVRVYPDLWKLYQAEPSPAEIARIESDFTLVWVDSTALNESWSDYENDGFDQTSTAPTKFAAYAKLDALRHQRFSRPLPMAEGRDAYIYLKHVVHTLYLTLEGGYNYGGGSTITLTRGFSVWDLRSSADPTVPFPDFVLAFYHSPLYLLFHEGRHSEPGDPGHLYIDGQQFDPYLENGSGHAWAALYLMWVYKYGLSDPAVIKQDARVIATSLLTSRFPRPVTHSDPEIQAIIDELLAP